MARPLRIEYPGAIYHVMNRGVARQAVFRETDDYARFLHVLGESHALWGVEVLAYCLMKNHYHLCLRTPFGNLARVMRHVNGVYTQRVNRAHRRDGAVFRGRYKALVIEVETYLAAVIRYIHLNPVNAKVVTSPEGYRWSSHGQYMNPRGAPPWLTVDDVLSDYGSPRAFHEFVVAGNEEALEAFYATKQLKPVLGTDRFRAWVRKKVRTFSREHPRHERTSLRPSVQQVIKAVANVFGVERSVLYQGRRGVANDARKIAMYLVKRLCDLTLQETASQFGVASYGSVGWACAHIRAKLAKDRQFRKQVAQLESKIRQPKI